jgi:membrane fusion protein (multidrug efflux system)
VVRVVPGDKPDTLVSERVTVKTGLRQPGKVEILEGLSADDTVVTAGHQRLQKDGTSVRVLDLSQSAGGKGATPAAGAAPAPAATPAAATSPALAAVAAPAAKAAATPAGPARKANLSGPNPCLRGADATR